MTSEMTTLKNRLPSGPLRMLLIPAVIYLVAFCLLTFPLITQFGSHFFADEGDGLQNVWNIWWVNKSVTELHRLPWYTTYLHYPQGTSLLGQTLNPFNGFAAIPLLKIFSLTVTYNCLVLFSFVFGGITAFWLAYRVTGSYWASLIGGAVFTFSEFHFMHAEGHLQLVSLEWIPLYILALYTFLEQPGVKKGVFAGVVLFLVLLCDYYYFFYCCLSSVVIFAWQAVGARALPPVLRKENLAALGSYLLSVLATCGPLVYALLALQKRDPLFGAHAADEFSLDLLAPFIPGGHWRFGELTRFYWSRLPGNIHESSVYLGLSVVVVMACTLFMWKKCRNRHPSLSLWWWLIAFFGLLALGPVLHLAGAAYQVPLTPYQLLQTVFPPLKMSGTPVRMMVMVTLCAGVLSAIGLTLLIEGSARRGVMLAAALAVLFVVDLLPAPLPATRLSTPGCVRALKELPPEGGLFTNFDASQALYYQTIHEKPLADGYISRYPQSVLREVAGKYDAARRLDFRQLRNGYGIVYVLSSVPLDEHDPQHALQRLHADSAGCLYRILP